MPDIVKRPGLCQAAGAGAMSETNRRVFPGARAFGAGAFATTRGLAAADDGHAAGYDVAPSSDHIASHAGRSLEVRTLPADRLSRGQAASASIGLYSIAAVTGRTPTMASILLVTWRMLLRSGWPLRASSSVPKRSDRGRRR
jgi:hypothetical protein